MILWNQSEILVVKAELIDKQVCFLKNARISLRPFGQIDRRIFKEEITSVCFDPTNLFLFVGTSLGALLTFDSKNGKLLGAQRVFALERILQICVDSANNLLIVVSFEYVKLLKIGFVSFEKQRLNRVMRRGWAYLK